MLCVLLTRAFSLKVSTGELLGKGMAFSQYTFIYFPNNLLEGKAYQVGDFKSEVVNLEGPIEYILLGDDSLKIDATSSPAEFIYFFYFISPETVPQRIYLLYGNVDNYMITSTDVPTFFNFINMVDHDIILTFSTKVALTIFDSKNVEYIGTPFVESFTLKPGDNCVIYPKNQTSTLTSFSVLGSTLDANVTQFDFVFPSAPLVHLQNGTSYAIELVPKPQEPSGDPIEDKYYTIDNATYNLPVAYDPVTINIDYIYPNDLLVLLNSQYSSIQADIYENNTLINSKKYTYNKSNPLIFLDSGNYRMKVTIKTTGNFAAIAQSMKANKRIIGSPLFCNLSIDCTNTHIIVWAEQPYTISQSGVSFTEISISDSESIVSNATITNAVATLLERSSGILILSNEDANNRSIAYKTTDQPLEWQKNNNEPSIIFKPESDGKLTPGAIAGISVGCVAAAIGISVGIFFLVRKPARVEGPVWQ